MIPLAMPNLGGKEKEYLLNCIDSTYVSSVGEYVSRLEKMSMEACGSKYAVAVSAGTTGLHAALTAAGVARDELVIIPTFTFIATANAVAHCGAQPWIMDIGQDWCLDPQIVEDALREECIWDGDKIIHAVSGKRVAAIMPVYTLGNIPDMERFMRIADMYGIPLIADAACAVGATLDGKNLGDLADLSILSFNGNKTITCGGGGMIVGNDKMLMEKVRHLTTTARINAEYDFDMVGFNYRMTNLQAAVGCAQMERLAEFVETKRKIRMYYNRAMKGITGITMFPQSNGSSCWFSGIVLDKADGLDDVRNICSKLKEHGIEARSFWKPIHLQLPYKDNLTKLCGRAEGLWNRIVTLPCSTGITSEELETVADCLKDILYKRMA